MKHTFKIEDVLETATKRGFTRHDFADLAIVAAKRSGATAAEQLRVAAVLGIEAEERDRGTKADHVAALARICEQLGGRLAIVPQREISTMFNRDWPDYDGPLGLEADAGFDLEHHEGFSSPDDCDSHGLEWRKQIVYAVRGRESVGRIIHEMGHVFASHYPPDSSRCREWSWFGWEMAIARQIGAWQTWSRHNEDYGVGRDDDWGSLSARRRQALIAERTSHAKKIGILGEAGEPRSIRR
ncbi:MAG TPA: hypothetical protein VLE97_10735 [Gaiellaceae bacterium]|nr:hypothetical protein [Gaiellaceae bacterium]